MMLSTWITQIVGSGRIADIAIGVIALEIIAIAVLMDRKTLARTGFTLASGLALLGALRTALTGGEAWTIALWLIGALIVHASDLYTRLFSPARRDGRGLMLRPD
ncbi:MAG: hypothetical protein KDJ51_01095 [Nitratireductor sp.]|nr:hypothetical protein [Nitratireductor sp.]